MGKFTENELVEVLNKYGTLSDNGEETILDKTLTTTDKVHEIKVSEIWDVPFEKSNIVKFSIANSDIMSQWFESWGNGNFEVPKGTTWKEFIERKWISI